MPRAASVYLLLASPERAVDHGALGKFDVDDGAVLDLDVVGFAEGVATRGPRGTPAPIRSPVLPNAEARKPSANLRHPSGIE
jgi:hypothetical protein